MNWIKKKLFDDHGFDEEVAKYGNLRRLKEKKIVDEDFLNRLTFVSLEDLVAIKLEQTLRITGGRFCGFSLMTAMRQILNEAVLKAVFSVSQSMRHAAMILGRNTTETRSLAAKYKILDKDKNYYIKMKQELLEDIGRFELEVQDDWKRLEFRKNIWREND